MRIIAYSSGAKPCGIADYHHKLAREFDASIECETVTLPTDTVYRDRPFELWERRRHYAHLAGRSRAYDASLIEMITHWNGTRAGEYMLPVFVNHLRRPFAIILHEWPPAMAAEASTPSYGKRLLARLIEGARRSWDCEGQSDEQWLRTQFLGRAGHIFVHSKALRDRVLEYGVAAERVTFAIHPVAQLSAGDTAVAEELKARFSGHRMLVAFGFPHPRKSLHLAIQALTHLPADVMLLFVGGLDGAFRQQYVQSLLQLAAQLGVQDRVSFIGEVPESSLKAVFECAQLAVAPFSYATGSGSFAYLMGAGVPIVASDLPEHRMLHDAGAGLSLFEGGNVAALVSAVTNLLNDQTRRQSLARQSQVFVAHHSFASFAHTVGSQLRQLITETSRNTGR